MRRDVVGTCSEVHQCLLPLPTLTHAPRCEQNFAAAASYTCPKRGPLKLQPHIGGRSQKNVILEHGPTRTFRNDEDAC